MKKIITIVLIIGCITCHGQFTSKTVRVGNDNCNMITYVPANTGTKKLPTVVFIPGNGEVGNDPDQLYVNGPLKFIKENGWRPNFIVIGIQPPAQWPQPSWVHAMLSDILKNNKNVDPNKFYLTGLSGGASGIFRYIREYTKPVQITAIVPFSMTFDPGENDDRYAKIAAWGLCGIHDSHSAKMKNFIKSLINKGYDAKWTDYDGDHCCWNTYYDPGWKENNVSIYDWMLQHSSTASGVSPPNDPVPGKIEAEN